LRLRLAGAFWGSLRAKAGDVTIHCSKLEPLIERGWMHRPRLAFASMSQNKLTTIYAGLDVAKATLQLSLLGAGHALDNDPKGHRQILALVQRAAAQSGAKIHLVLEATGGYEKAAVRALHAAGIALSVLLPSRVRAFAYAQGRLAKTDPIDAHVLAAFGAALAPAPTAVPSAAQVRLEELVARRAQLIETLVAEKNRAAHYTQKELVTQNRRLEEHFKKAIAQCDRLIGAQIAAVPEMAARSARLQEVCGVGAVSAAVLVAEMPELGTLSDEEAAALAGLAPYNRDSGPHAGKRSIHGGRAAVRCALYMAALSAMRHDRILRAFHQRLRTAGKAKMVALTAVMRKLIVLLNRLVKNPNFKLRAA
jgi:transposase